MIDLNYLKITTGNDIELIRKLINLFLDQLPDLKINILRDYENEDWDALIKSAHKAKGSFMIIGDQNQSEELTLIGQMAIEKKSKSEYSSLIENFKNNCDQVVIELKKHI